jgi:hypothetical protein
VCRRGLLGSAHFLSKNIYHLGFKKAELGLFCVLGVLSGEFTPYIRKLLLIIALI